MGTPTMTTAASKVGEHAAGDRFSNQTQSLFRADPPYLNFAVA